MPTHDLHGVLVDIDGTRTDVALAAGGSMHKLAETHLGGFPDYGHYGRPGATITVVVHELSQLNGMPANRVATDFVGLVRNEALSAYDLHGPVIVFGFDPRTGDLADLAPELRDQLHAFDSSTTGGAGRD